MKLDLFNALNGISVFVIGIIALIAMITNKKEKVLYIIPVFLILLGLYLFLNEILK